MTLDGEEFSEVMFQKFKLKAAIKSKNDGFLSRLSNKKENR